MDTEIQTMIARALSAGWDEAEICCAITSLADHHILGMLSNEKTAEEIARADQSGIVLRARE